MKVRAKELGYYNLKRRRKGDVFVLLKADDYSAKWMEHLNAKNNKVPPKAAEPKKVPIKDADGTIVGYKPASGPVQPESISDEVIAAEAAAAEDQAFNSDAPVTEGSQTQSDMDVI